MFEQAFVECQARTARPWTVAVSFAGQMLFVALMVLLPLVHTGVMVPARWANTLTMRPPGPQPRAIAADKSARAPGAKASKAFYQPALQQPARVPDRILIGEEIPQPVLFSDSQGPTAPTGGGISLFETAPVAAPPQRAPEPAPVAPGRIRVASVLQAGRILQQVSPVYPTPARVARISGQVRLEAVIAKDGRIRNLHVVSGHPMLVQAALEAVREWVYRPTFLNGDPVEVMTVIDVNFALR